MIDAIEGHDPIRLAPVVDLIDRVARAWKLLLGTSDNATPSTFVMLLDTIAPAEGSRPYYETSYRAAMRLEGMELLLDAAGSRDRHALLLRALIRVTIALLRGRQASADLEVAKVLTEEIEEDLHGQYMAKVYPTAMFHGVSIVDRLD
ncbi:hypothetical protein CcrC1_gp055c [Caulobacter phage C1]|nr:hypothetical protein CcrC1_gp055c [Caulobacter phage C1]UTU08282.1 hypothetical protein CcrC2_gp054c [Caulobacter phage C2]UTU08805.1 hypothetical protein CcrJ4_gp054c [Caulobacter phage J4]UTU09357.1 hypothetical protein CcrBL47_gp071c [Caulobacter phage BL47]UTU09917.1 hypothetical protein CcrRB23_gp055c [Caulobacter phage RB23]WGN96942.1 hypothetical protein [Bertelyvirus sp.]